MKKKYVKELSDQKDKKNLSFTEMIGGAFIPENSIMDNSQPVVSCGRKKEIILPEDPYTGYDAEYAEWN